jgi:DnaD/phage-associated family protein
MCCHPGSGHPRPLPGKEILEVSGTRPVIPPEFVFLSVRVALACSEHPHVFLTLTYLEMLSWGAESRSIKFDGDWFNTQFGIPQSTLLRHLHILSRQPILAVLVYRSAGAGSRIFEVTLAAKQSSLRNETVSDLIIPVVVKEFKDLELKNKTTGIESDTVSNLIWERPNIFKIYEENFGSLTPFLADALRDAERDYPPEWIVAAVEIAVGNNKRFWAYAESILKRWKSAGKMTRKENGHANHGKPVEVVISEADENAALAILAMQNQ